jgi:hypothetical protein
MAKHLTLLLLKLFFISSILSFIGIAIVQAQQPAHQHACDMSGLAYGLSLGIILSLTLSATTIYLNLKTQVRDNTFYSTLSFFLLPLIVAILLLVSIGDPAAEWLFFSITLLPFITAISFYFYRFRNTIPHYEIPVDRNTPV